MRFESAIFIDTSVQLLRFIGSKEVKAQVDRRISSFPFSVTGLVVRQEFKRRFLTDVRYVKGALEKNKFCAASTLRHINSKLSMQVNRRKLSICLDLLAVSAFEIDGGVKLHLLLSSWEDFGLDFFDESVGHVVRFSGCGCGMSQDLGPMKCKSVKNCAINEFIKSRNQEANTIYSLLSTCQTPRKTSEIVAAENLLTRWLVEGKLPDSDNPCLTVGDLIVALESKGVPVFYTQNAKESQFFCKAQNQTMIVQRDGGDEVRSSDDCENWPAYT